MRFDDDIRRYIELVEGRTLLDEELEEYEPDERLLDYIRRMEVLRDEVKARQSAKRRERSRRDKEKNSDRVEAYREDNRESAAEYARNRYEYRRRLFDRFKRFKGCSICGRRTIEMHLFGYGDPMTARELFRASEVDFRDQLSRSIILCDRCRRLHAGGYLYLDRYKHLQLGLNVGKPLGFVRPNVPLGILCKLYVKDCDKASL